MKSRKVKSIFKVMIFGKLKRNPRKQKRPAGRGEEGITDKIGMTFGFDASEWGESYTWNNYHILSMNHIYISPTHIVIVT